MKKVIEVTYAKDHSDLEREYGSVADAVDAIRKAFAPRAVTSDVAASADKTDITEGDWSVTGGGSRELILMAWAPDGGNAYQVAVIEESVEED